MDPCINCTNGRSSTFHRVANSQTLFGSTQATIRLSPQPSFKRAPMRFTQDLEQTAIPEWSESYLDYKKLKTSLAEVIERGDGDAASFHQALDDELEKVNRFYMDKITQYEVTIEAIATGPRAGEYGIGGAGGADAEGMKDPKADAPEAGGEAQAGAAGAAAALPTLDFTVTYSKLGQLQSYVWLNSSGFSKIMKKFDKKMGLRGSGKEQAPEFDRRLAAQVFMSARLDSVLERAKFARDRVRKANTHRVGGHIQLINGSGNPALAKEVAGRLGIPLTPAKVGRFADGECQVQLNDSVRGADVFIIQPTCFPVNDNLMELLLLISAAKRASCNKVTAVVPYYGYARQDRKERSRVPISAADVARMFEAMGVDRMICVDLHCGQIQGFFGPTTPVDNLYASPIAWTFFSERNLVKPVVISPDAGGVARAKLFREGLFSLGLEATMAVIIKQRSAPGVIGSTDLVGNVDGCDCIIVDDMIDTAGTLCAAANELRSFGARRVFAFATHGLLNGPAAQRIEDSVLEGVIVANTIPLQEHVSKTTKKVRQLSVGKLLAVAIHACHRGESVSHLFEGNAGALLA